MSSTPWFKFYPSDFLGAIGGLSPAERGVLITIMALIYDWDGPIKLDMKRLARRCGATPIAFKNALDVLLDTGHLKIIDGFLTNERAEKELLERTERCQNSSNGAKARWQKSSQKTKGNQYDDDAAAQLAHSEGNAKPEVRNQKPEKGKGKGNVENAMEHFGNTPPLKALSPDDDWQLIAERFKDNGELRE